MRHFLFFNDYYSQIPTNPYKPPQNQKKKEKALPPMKTLASLGLLLVSLLHWIPQHQLQKLESHFGPLQKWCQENPNGQHFPLGIFTGLCLITLLPKNKPQKTQNPYQTKILLPALLSCLILITLEVSQLLTPSRSFDIKDILWGSCGAFLILAALKLSSKLKLLKINTAFKQHRPS
jgi:glycopeptide antibiotics resistance protein